jgi:hypothetical protein
VTGANVSSRSERITLKESRSEAESSQTNEKAGARERETEAFGGGAISGEADPEGCGLGKLLSPERRRCAVEHAREQYEVSERHACRLLGQWRRTQRYAAIQRIEEALTEAIVALAINTGATATGELRRCCNVLAGTWARIGYSGPGGRLWLKDGSCVRLRPERANHELYRSLSQQMLIWIRKIGRGLMRRLSGSRGHKGTRTCRAPH